MLGSNEANSRKKRGITVGAGIGLIVGAELGKVAVGLVVGAALGAVGILVVRASGDEGA